MTIHGRRMKRRLGLPNEGEMPALDGATAWLNSAPLTPQDLRGKVVLVDFWTYSCINCLRALPYVSGWYEKYKDHGLVVIGVHAPEFAFEKDIVNVRRAVADLHIDYPVALDDNYAIWQGFNNQFWPRTISSMRRAASAAITSARATTRNPSNSSAAC